MDEGMNSCELDLLNEQGKCILIVEDDKDIRQSLEMLLEDMGYDVFCAENGRVALDMMPRIPKPSLILLDLMMPVMNGWDFEKELAKDDLYASIPIVVLTAAPGNVNTLRCKELLKKPIQLDALLPIVKHNFFRGVYSESEDADFSDFTSNKGDYQE